MAEGAGDPDGKHGWAAMAPTQIPTKPELHPSFVAAITKLVSPPRGDPRCSESSDSVQGSKGRSTVGGGAAGLGCTLLDLGCGDGRLTRRLVEEFPLTVVGVDLNVAAVAAASEEISINNQGEHAALYAKDQPATGEHEGGAPMHQRLRFEQGDVATHRVEIDPGSELENGSWFAAVLLQLVLSVVGGVSMREKVLRNAAAHLQPGGILMLSASGASEEINKEYAALYAKDQPATGEYRTYYSRGATGRVLYVTHHFTQPELRALLDAAGFEVLEFVVSKEASSRRPGMAAFFYYVIAAKRVQATLVE